MTAHTILAALGAVEFVGVLLTVALCRAAARRPIYGPPLYQSRATDR